MLILYLDGLVLLIVAVVAWWMWKPVVRLTTVELQVQEFNRQVREWDNGASSGD